MTTGPLSRRTFLVGVARGAGVRSRCPRWRPCCLGPPGPTTGSRTDLRVFLNGLPWRGPRKRLAGPPISGRRAPRGRASPPPPAGPARGTLQRRRVSRHGPTSLPRLPARATDTWGFMVALTADRPRSEGFDHPTHTLTARRPTIDRCCAERAFIGDRQTPSGASRSGCRRRASTTTGTGMRSRTTARMR